jgi:hypothetical protein
METPTAIKVGTWIEREVHGTYCPWAKVVHVYQEDWISVVYLDGDTPVKDDFQFVDGRWGFKYEGVSGFKIRGGADTWRETLRSGPPHRIRSSAPWIEYLQPEDIVLLPRRPAASD